MRRSFDAILVDLDGTLVDERDQVHPRTLEALRAADAAGVAVMVATGRSETATIPVLDALGLDGPAVVFNGAGIWCPRERRLIEERVLADVTVRRALDYGLARGHMTVTMCRGTKYVMEPAAEVERMALEDMTGLTFVSTPAELAAEYAIRVTLFSDRHADSGEFAAEVEAHVGRPVYTTHFPLCWLPRHRSSALLVCDLHPPCRGKAEGLRFLEETRGIPPARVVAVGDATNDLPMFERAGLAVAMEGSFAEARDAADRIIGAPGTGTIGELVEELFLDPGRRDPGGSETAALTGS